MSKHAIGAAGVHPTLVECEIHLYQNGIRLKEEDDEGHYDPEVDWDTSTPAVANIVDLKPGPFQVYIQIPHSQGFIGNVLVFVIAINDAPITYHLCVPKVQIPTHQPYLQYISTLTTNGVRKSLEAPGDINVVSVTARFAKGGGFEVKGPLQLIDYRQQHWMIEPPNTAVEVPTVGQDVQGGRVDYHDPKVIRVQYEAEMLEYKFRVKGVERKGEEKQMGMEDGEMD